MKLRLIFYDIADDRLRTRLAKRLEAVGLQRLQYSVFVGRIRAQTLRRVLWRFRKALAEEDRLYVLPLTETQLSQMQMHGQPAELGPVIAPPHTRFL